MNIPHVVAEAIVGADAADAEAIVVNLNTGTYFSVRGDAILLWNAIIAGAAAEEIVEAVVEMTGEAGETIAAVIADFCASLAEHGLIVERDGYTETPPAFDLSAGGAGLLEPSLAIYTDMQDLILLDPVHEVDARGWPHAQASA